MGPIKTSQFAELWFIGEELESLDIFTSEAVAPTSSTNSGDTQPVQLETGLVRAGIVTQLRIQENLNSTQTNVIGTPVPIFSPGYYSATISADKATLDLKSFKNMINMNPLSAFRPDSYANGVNKIQLPDVVTKLVGAGLNENEQKIPRFTFLLFVKDMIAAGGYSTNDKEAGSDVTSGKISTNVGIYVCMMQTFNLTLSSDNSVVMESVSMLARPIAGSWFNAISDIYNLSPGFGYSHNIKPLRKGY